MRTAKSRYPVIYMLHGLNWSNERMLRAGKRLRSRPSIAPSHEGVIRPFIAVAPDYTTHAHGTFFANSTTAGRFEDYTLPGSHSVHRLPTTGR